MPRFRDERSPYNIVENEKQKTYKKLWQLLPHHKFYNI